MSNIRIVTLADLSYFEYLKSLVNSIHINLPDVKIHAYLINLQDVHGDILKSIHPNLEYTIENVKFKFDLQKRCYCTNRRGKILKDLRDSTNDILIWLDADSLIVKECRDLIEFAETCDLSIRPKNKSDLTKVAIKQRRLPHGFMAGVIIVGNSEKSKLFTDMYDKNISQTSYKKVNINYDGPISKLPKNIKNIWMCNQDILVKIHKSIRGKLLFKALPQRYLDCSFRDDTAIWSVKASNRGNKKFARMLSKFGGK